MSGVRTVSVANWFGHRRSSKGEPYAIRSDGTAYCVIPVRHTGKFIDMRLKYRISPSHIFPPETVHFFGGHGLNWGGFCVVHNNNRDTLGPWCFGANGGYAGGLSEGVEHEIRMLSTPDTYIGEVYVDGVRLNLNQVASRSDNNSWMLVFAANMNGETEHIAPHIAPADFLEIIELDYSDLNGYSARFRPAIVNGMAGFVDVDSGYFMGAHEGLGSLIPVWE